MIAQITGKLISKKATEVVVDCRGVGYLLIVSTKTSENLPEIGKDLTLKTLLIPKDDVLLLFGFIDEIEREIFKMLLMVTGIGPKSAIAILSSVSTVELSNAIAENNLTLLQKMPGIGKKTAERILIELRDKISKIGLISDENFAATSSSQEAIAALVALGYNKSAAEKNVKKALNTLPAEATIEEIIRVALKLAMN